MRSTCPILPSRKPAISVVQLVRFTPPNTARAAANVTINAQRDIIHLTANGADDSSQQLPSNWLYRRDDVANGSFIPTNNLDQGFGDLVDRL